MSGAIGGAKAEPGGRGTVLVTGVGGFIGRALMPRLAQSGWQVVGTDRGAPPDIGHLARYEAIDIGASNAGAVLDSLPAVDAVVHAGGISGFMVARDNPLAIFETNVAGTMTLLEFARRRGVRRLVLCSTIMVYGPEQATLGPVDEDLAPIPASVYGASKAAIEALAHGYAGQHGLDAIALRFSHVYGPGRTTECFVRDMVAAALARRPCHVGQPSGSHRQYVHVHDVCSSIIAALDAAPGGQRVFNISGDAVQTLAEVRDVVRRVIGPFDVTFDEQANVPAYRLPRLSIRRAAEQLRYRVEMSLEAGVADLARQARGAAEVAASASPVAANAARIAALSLPTEAEPSTFAAFLADHAR